ncbi:hypothetical protein [Aureimonas sp. ME7]|uniref:hypothetical protein n=1 Tax=Aureimonas sp. ME7 TaxID=2744252 RepID=UPI0015F611EF|nr:hypothetical protein [Aureimonas sp. ME7]
MTIDLYRLNGGPPEELPAIAYTADGAARTDLANQPASLVELGYVLAPPKPDDTDAQTAEWDAEAEAWVMVDRPPLPQPPMVEPVPMSLGKGEFLDLVLSTGATISQVRAASDDALMADFWWALDRFYSEIKRDHPSTTQGLAAMVALGHITQAQADQVFATWPVR